jgi:hypothetical protein
VSVEESLVGLHLSLGQRVFDSASGGEFIVVRAPDTDLDLTIGGQSPILEKSDSSAPAGTGPSAPQQAALGKRYASDDGGLELLCVKPGAHLPVLAGRPLDAVQPKPLPASD